MHPEQINALVLAYLGDAILEVLVRDHLVMDLGVLKPNDLQKRAVSYVGAKSQAAFMRACKNEDWLSEEEMGWYRRGRNTKGRRAIKNLDVMTHNESSGFEAVLGTLHILGNEDRIQEIFELYCRFIETEKEAL